MTFISLTEEQVLLQSSVNRFCETQYDIAVWQKNSMNTDALAKDTWAEMTEIGLPALNVPEDQGGLAFGSVETMLLMEQFGRYLMREPFVSTCVAAPAALLDGGAAADRCLEEIASGQAWVSLAHVENNADFNAANIEMPAIETENGFVLNGTKTFVADGADADYLIVAARTSGVLGESAGITLFLVPQGANGLKKSSFRSSDRRRHASITFDQVEVPSECVIGKIGQGYDRLESAIHSAISAQLAEAMGAMDALREASQEYLKTRKQFGRFLGEFQVLQHRLVDMHMACEEARSMLHLVTLSRSDTSQKDSLSLLHAAKALVGERSLSVANEAVQLHGGMGTSDELLISHYLKRLMTLDTLYGNSAHHTSSYAEMVYA
jgi:alkylation response protein AidB-like acyl-CoA dehydrogenase